MPVSEFLNAAHRADNNATPSFRTVSLAACALIAIPALGAEAEVDFQRDIRPLLAKRCFACHGPDANSRKANLRLDTREGATGMGGGLTGIVPGSSAQSRVVARISHLTRPMPPEGERLTSAQIEMIKKWIDAGALYRNHWSFDRPVRPDPPAVRHRGWLRNAIDHFVLAKLEQQRLNPSREADRRTLARRLSLDLIGLPPSPELVREFAADNHPDAYERLVDRLLAMPQYGERWARVWLDLARYADTQGYERDFRRSVWPYRDWLIRAFNANMPFDQFTIQQLAGDLLPSPSQDDLIATGFHRNTMTNSEAGSDDEEYRGLAVKDRVAVTGQVWMGLTWGCAQCHTHKYDPISHTEFYQLYAFLNQTEDADRYDDAPSIKVGDGSTLVMRELAPDKQRVTRIHLRGNFLDPGPEVTPGTPAALHSFPQQSPRNRLGLAQWLVSKDNPLTARVTVNRFWARLFGRGIVESEEDFGTQGSQPSHPQLLDWLATEFMQRDWDMKGLLKTIVMSATYRQVSDASPELLKRDPYNRLLARGARYRLDAEAIRDQALSVSGLLSSKMYGAPVMPWQPEGIWQVVYNSEQWLTGPGEDRYRRSLYTFLRRTSPYPWLAAFDAPGGDVCAIRRIRTNTPLQALASLNDPLSMEAAQRLALRTLREAELSDKARASRMFELVLGREPTAQEAQRILTLHRQAADLRPGDSAQSLLHQDKLVYPQDREVVIVADARTEPSEWRYTLDAPAAKWSKPGFDASSWKTGKGRFGVARTPSAPLPSGYPGAARIVPVNTTWESEQIWLRIEFDMPAGAKPEHSRLLVNFSGGFDAFLNGLPAASSIVERSAYFEYPIDGPALASLKTGRNVLAVRAYRTFEGGRFQGFDASLVALRDPDFGPKHADDASRAAWVVVANTILNLDEAVTRR